MTITGALLPPAWTEQAICAQVDPELFFPEKGGATTAAKQLCAGCPVRTDCLNYAVEHNIRFGIWGGLAERDRRHLKTTALPTKPAPTENAMPTTDTYICDQCDTSTHIPLKDGLCHWCRAEAEEPADVPQLHPTAEPTEAPTPAPVEVVADEPTATESTPELPPYALTAAELLATTEKHHDPVVRSARRIAAQALEHLATLTKAAEKLTANASTPAADAKPAATRAPSRARQLIQEHQLDPGDIRSFGVDRGLCGTRGALGEKVVLAYLRFRGIQVAA